MERRSIRARYWWVALGAGLAVPLCAAGRSTGAPGQDPPRDSRPATTKAGAAWQSAERAAPASAPRLDVTVVDPDGQPLAEAFVVARPASRGFSVFGSRSEDEVRTARTDREGKAQLESLPPGPWNVTASARGFYGPPARRVVSGPLVLRLTRGGEITGIIRDGKNGEPVSGARVAVAAGLPVPGDWSGGRRCVAGP